MQHKSRWITALILIPLVLGVLWTGNPLALGGLVCIAGILAFYEYWIMIRAWQTDENIPIFSSVPILLISSLTALSMAGATIYASVQGLILALCANLILMSLFSLRQFPRLPLIFEAFAWQIFGVVYIFVPLCLVMAVLDIAQGEFWILWILIVTFANDTCAFYVGTAWGKHKLAPALSPKKSVEGALGGICGSMVSGTVFCLIFFQSFSLTVHMIPCTMLMAIAGQTGDLIESAMKRRAEIKDSGKILPGHGGILDRIDGLLFTLPVAYAYLVLIIQ